MKKLIRESLNESIKSSPIDSKKLKEYANAINVICNGEYGSVYLNEEENHVLIILGDANPFDEYLNDFMSEAISKDYTTQKEINITIENEISAPNGDGWKKIK